MSERWEPGRLVVSTAGRDRGKFYLVLGIAPDNRVHVVDGEQRSIAKPKCKNEKHLRPYPEISARINEKFKAGLKVTDLEVQRELKEIITSHAES